MSYIFLPIIFIGITIFTITQLCDENSNTLNIPIWFILLFLLYFIPLVNVAIFLGNMFLLIASNTKVRKNSLLEKILKLLNKEIWI